MKRRNFIGTIAAGGTAIISTPISGIGRNLESKPGKENQDFVEFLKADAVVIGGGLGGYASALSLFRNNKDAVEINQN